MKAVGIRELKDRLSRYLEDVRRGEVILVTDRGRVVAELRAPGGKAEVLSPLAQRLQPFVASGVVVAAAAPNAPDAYSRPSFSIPASRIDAELDGVRSDR